MWLSFEALRSSPAAAACFHDAPQVAWYIPFCGLPNGGVTNPGQFPLQLPQAVIAVRLLVYTLPMWGYVKQ